MIEWTWGKRINEGSKVAPRFDAPKNCTILFIEIENKKKYWRDRMILEWEHESTVQLKT